MTTTTPPATKQLTVPEQKRLTLRRLFDSQKPELSKLLPRSIDPERLLRMALTECVKQPKLLECTAESWAIALQVCAAQQLLPDSGLGFMYLVPRKNRKKNEMEVSAMRGYQGDIKLARRSGEIVDIWAEVVYAKDTYKVTKGLDRNIVHVPYDGDDEPGDLRACYAVAKLRDGGTPFVTLTARDVARHRASSESAGEDWSPWNKHTAAMWKKTAIHELSKWLPKETEAAEQVARALLTGGDGRAIETTAIDLGNVEIPIAGPVGGALDQVAAALEGEAGAGNQDPAAGALCPDHPTQTIQNGDGSRACFAEGCPWPAPKHPADAPKERIPGEDDDDPAPAHVIEGIRAVASKAGDTTKAPDKPGRQRTL